MIGWIGEESRYPAVLESPGGPDARQAQQRTNMPYDLVVIGASAGGVEALKKLVSTLPEDLPAAVLVVLHVPPYGGSVLPAILDRAGQLPVRHATSGDPITAGQILVAPPDHHLFVEDGRVLLTKGARENGHRPAVDVLFRSAARARGAGVISVVLSGVLDDGTAGAVAVRQHRGLVLVQDPHDASYPAMPESVLAHLNPDYVASAGDLGALIDKLCRASADGEPPARQPAAHEELPAPPADLIDTELGMATLSDEAYDNPDRPGTASGFSCPDCAGTLFEISDGTLTRYRCRVGHAWSPESLLGEQSVQLEGALWMALRSLEEKAALASQLATRAQTRGSQLSAGRFAEQAEDATRAARLIRQLLEAAPQTSRIGTAGREGY
jgi:two-component system, chemotaxis family, protein-glutamate methylesterase/glutaminase